MSIFDMAPVRSRISHPIGLVVAIVICLAGIASDWAHDTPYLLLLGPAEKPYVMKKPSPDPDWNRPQERLEFLAKLRELGIDPAAYVSAQAADRPGFELPKRAIENVERQALLTSVRPFSPPAVAEADRLMIGNVPISEDVATSGILVTGATGAGKTRLFYQIIDQVYSKGIQAHFIDIKGESRSFHQRWRDAMVFSLQNAPWQWLEPPPGCDPLSYFPGVIAQLRTEFDLRTETFPLAYRIYERIVRGLRPGDPYPSWSDFRIVLEHEADATGRENLHTLARVFLNIETVLGPNARVRRVPDISNRYRITAFEMVGQDVAVVRAVIGLYLNKLIHAAHNEEHTTGLRSLEIIDEAAALCSVDLTHKNAPTINSLAQFATMSRFTGRPLDSRGTKHQFGSSLCKERWDHRLLSNAKRGRCYRRCSDAWSPARRNERTHAA